MKHMAEPEFSVGGRESTLLLEAQLSDSEMQVLTDSAFVYADEDELDPESENTALNTAMTRLQQCGHSMEDGGYRVRCALTDAELDAFVNAGSEVNPQSSKPTLSRMQNRVKTVEELYKIDVHIPIDYPEKLRSTEVDSLRVLANYTTTTVLSTPDGAKARAHLTTYLTAEEYNELQSLTVEDIGDELQTFCDATVDIVEKFDPETERNEYIDEVSVTDRNNE